MKTGLLALSLAFQAWTLTANADQAICSGTYRDEKFGNKSVVITQNFSGLSLELQGLQIKVNQTKRDLEYQNVNQFYVSPAVGTQKSNSKVMMSLYNDGLEAILVVEYVGPKNRLNSMWVPGRLVSSNELVVSLKDISCQVITDPTE
jgi:hypothetical protein